MSVKVAVNGVPATTGFAPMEKRESHGSGAMPPAPPVPPSGSTPPSLPPAPPDAPAEPVLIQRALAPILDEESERIEGIRFRTHIPRDLPPVVIDDVAFTRLLRTLVTAVAELGPGRGIVEVLAQVAGPLLVFRVVGRQVHIADDVLEALFDPGVNLHPQAPHGRTQFGLAAARTTAARLGGDVWARRSRGGLELGLELPIGTEDDVRVE